MPELMGVAALEGWDDAHRDGFARMRGAAAVPASGLSASGPPPSDLPAGRWLETTLAHSRVAVLQLHANDPVGVSGDQRFAAGWIGRTPASEDGEDALVAAALVRALDARDDRLPSRLPAPFALAVQRESPPTLWLVSDRHGLHPLYYARRGPLLAFSTKLAPLLAGGMLPWSLDARAVLDLCTYEHVTGDRTLADPVRVLPPGAVLRVDAGGETLRAWARLERRNAPLSTERLAERLHEELSRSVGEALRGRARAAITLSGGLDSRALLGCALEQGASLRTYTFGTRGCADAALAERLAAHVGVRHTSLEIDGRFLSRWLEHGVRVTGGAVSCLHYHVTALAERLAAEADVVLDGLGGDALTGGHLSPGMLLARSPGRAADALFRRRAIAWTTPGERAEIFHSDFLAEARSDPREAVEAPLRATDGAPPWWGCHVFDLRERQRRFVQFGPHQLRPFVDVQTPFYAAPLVALLAGARPSQLFAQRAYLRMHARHLGRLAAVPDADLGMPLSRPLGLRLAKRAARAVARRALPRRSPSAGTTDYPTWFRCELRELLEDRLLGGRAVADRVLRRPAVERLLREHRDGAADHATKLGCLLTLETWLGVTAG